MYRNARAEMVRRGFNMTKVAALMNKSISTISGWLSGETAITVNDAKSFKQTIKSDLPLEVLFEKYEEAS
jgi:transcriptional regulator with XRE-family HTH domain